MKKIIFQDNDIAYGAVTLKDLNAPEKNNMALHVCFNSEDVMLNRERLAKETLPLEDWCLLWQKHTANAIQVFQSDRGKGSREKETSIFNVDAIYTTEEEVLIGVFTADCVGIFLVDETTPCICCIHSGWKGTAQAITDKTVKELIKKKFIHPEKTKAYFSPSVLFDSLEVGMEVVEQIQKLNFDTSSYIRYQSNEKAFIDNQGLNVQMLINNGIQKENIYPTAYDTKKDQEHCFSYRNDKKTGEHFTFGYLKKRKGR